MTTILQAISDPRLFGQQFRDANTWASWRAFTAALFGLPLTKDELRTFTECTQRSEANADGYREAWLVVGRRGGKSFALALIATFLATFKHWRPFLGPGEIATIMVVAADRKQARVIMRYCQGLINSVPMLAAMVIGERNESIALNNRVVIEVHTASFRTTRGYAICAALLDEISFWPTDEGSAEPDREVIAAIRPGMATIPGAMLLCASSPYARKGALYEAYRRHFGKEGDPVLVWHADTRKMNPTVPQSVIDEAMEADPASAQAEYLAQFRSDIEGFISREAVAACTASGVFERPYYAGLKYAAFTDPSGGIGDSFTLCIAHRDADSLFVDLIREMRPPFSPEQVVTEFAGTLKSYRISKVIGDRYAGQWPVEQFRKHGIRYEQSARAKSDLYTDLLPLINSRRVELLDHPRLLNQFIGLERRTARSGRDSIDHASGGHDDLANACAGALLSALSAHKRRLLRGAYGYGGGPITWWDAGTGEEIDPATSEPIQRQRIRLVNVPEALAPAAKGKS